MRPHAVNQAGSNTYSYYANGNLTSGAGRTVSWTPFNAPLVIAQGAVTLSFTYDAENHRVKQVVAGAETVIYLNDPASGARAEKLPLSGGGTDWNDYVMAGGEMVAVRHIRASVNAGTPFFRYLHKDHLGSVAAITDAAGAVVERLAYDDS